MIRYDTPAIIAAQQDEALTHGQVLYGLIKPTKDMDQIESTAAMVNVIPKKRIYLMESVEEIDLFVTELMKRPLVLQPSVHIGRGLAMINCAFYTQEEKWILLLNQVHGKIRSKLDIGVQTAKNMMMRGIPFTVTISLNEYLQRIYFDHLTKAPLNPKFTFVEIKDAEIVIRSHGQRGTLRSQAQESKLTFDDLLPSETRRRGVTDAQSEWRNPALRVIMPDELNQFLPGWGFEQEDPFANLSESEDELDEGAAGGIEIHQEREHLMPPGASRNAGGGAAGEFPTAPQPQGRIMGRAQRKANQNKYQVPIELHIPEKNGTQRLEGNPDSSWENPPPHYEDLQGNRHRSNEHPYEERRFQSSGPPRSPHSPPNREDETSFTYKQQNSKSTHSPNYLSSPSSPHRPGAPSSPRGPYSPQTPEQMDRYRGDNSRSPRTPTAPHLDQSRSPRTSTMPGYHGDGSRSPHTPTTPRFDGADRYNTEAMNRYKPQQTYLTDDNDDDGGFAMQSPRSRAQSENKYESDYNRHMETRSRAQSENKYESDYNRNIESSRYSNGKQYDPRDRYTSPASPGNPHRMSPNDPNYVSHGNNEQYRGNFPPSNRPIPAQRGLHHHQGSGRSDTTTSDSGFDDFDSSRQKDRNSDHNNIGKAPYYNHAFEKDMSPERNTNITDILAQHKAMASKMMHQNQGVPNSGGYQGDNSYGREVQKWRRNINELEEACDDSSVGFSQTRTLSNYTEQEQMAESFI